MEKEEIKKELRKVLSERIRTENGIEWVADSLIELIEELSIVKCDHEFKEVLMLVLEVVNKAPDISLLGRKEIEEVDRPQLLDLE